MREILFRGKSAKTGEWIYGYFVNCADRYDDPSDTVPEIIEVGADRTSGGFYDPLDVYSVNPETVGQWTGLVDKNGKKIFEGDLVSIYGSDELVVIEFSDAKNMNEYGIFSWNCIIKDHEHYLHRLENKPSKYEVIGNIHDNPELIGGNT